MTAPAPTTCPRCDGDGFIEAVPLSRALNAIVEVPCPDCCCSCGVVTGVGGWCDDCEDQDWLDAEMAYGRSQDR